MNARSNRKIARRQGILGLTLLVSLLFLSGCTPLVKIEQPQTLTPWSLAPTNTLGQTFTARYAGLDGIVLTFQPTSRQNGELRLHLRAAPTQSDDLRTASLPLSAFQDGGYQRLSFAPLPDSNRTDYYLELELIGSEPVILLGGPSDSYLQGALYQQGEPQEGQLAFRLSYDRPTALQGLIQEGLRWGLLLLAAGWLFVLPGGGILLALWPGFKALNSPEKFGLAAGVSLPLLPLLFLWTDMIGLNLGWLYAWILPLLGLGLILWKMTPWRAPIQPLHLNLPELSFWGLAALVALARLWPLRNLDLPMWGDSYQHSLMTQLLLDHHGLFSSWEPYAPLQTFTYHFGFHSAAAVFSWLTSLPSHQSVLWVGQILNVLAVLSLAPLAAKVSRSRWAAPIAVLVAGLLSPMPMFYVNWGRYTQLAAQVILPAGLILAWSILDAPHFEKRLSLLAGLTWGGLALTHYRILIFALLFLPAYFLISIEWRRWPQKLARVLPFGAGAALLFLPWFWRAFGGRLLRILAVQVSTPAAQVSQAALHDNTIGDLTQYLPTGLWLLLFVAVGYGLWRRERPVAWMAVWWLFNLIAALPHWIGLPGLGVITGLTVMIAIYLPAAVLLGAAGAWLIEDWKGSLNPRVGFLLTAVLVVAGLGLGAYGLRQRLHDLHIPTSALATRPDLRASAWIQANTPAEARFLVDSFFAYGGSLVSGSDGGWWLPLLAQRQTNLPPLLYGSEAGPTPDYIDRVNHLTAVVQEKGVAAPETITLLRQQGISYVYIGQQRGRVSPAGPNLHPEELLLSPAFRPVYHQDRVWIFELIGQ